MSWEMAMKSAVFCHTLKQAISSSDFVKFRDLGVKLTVAAGGIYSIKII